MKSEIQRRLIPAVCFFFVIFVIASATIANAILTGGTIETYVGGGNGDGSAAINATIDPRGLVVTGDPNGPDVYVADAMNNRVRRVDGATGLIVTIAGNGIAGFGGDGGQGQNASLYSPFDVAVDAAGNAYIADMLNNRIRKVGTDGRISTLAGTGQQAYTGDGIASQVALNSPYGVAVGPDGNVYIADTGNNRIRKVSPPGCAAANCLLTTVAGNGTWGFSGDNGPATGATLSNPMDVAFDSAGTMYIADKASNRIRRVTSDGVITTVAGGGSTLGDGGPGVQATLSFPQQVATDSSGNVYIADTGNRRIRMLQAGTFIISTVAGTGNAGTSGDGGAATNATLYAPYGVAATTPGTFWLAQSIAVPISQYNRVRAVTSGVIQSVIGGGLGNGGPAGDALIDPRGGQAINGGGPLPDLYFADGNNNVVRRVDGTTDNISTFAGSGVAGYSGDGGPAVSASLNWPTDAAVDPTTGNVYVADSQNNVIRQINSNGTITTVAGTGVWGYNGEGSARQATLAAPSGIDVDRNGNLYIADQQNYRIRKVSGGQISTVAGNGTWGSGGDGGLATAASLRNPSDVVVTQDGSLYISDTQGYRIRRVDPFGIITTVAGTGVSGNSGDGGLAALAQLNLPSYLSLDSAGNLFIADSQNDRIRRVDAVALTIATVAGNGQTGYSGDGGPATSASFSKPTGVAVDPTGSYLFIAANADARIRLVTSAGLISSPTSTATPIPPTPTWTALPPTSTRTPTLVNTPTNVPTQTRTSTVTRTPTVTQTGTRTATSTKTGTATSTFTPGAVNVSVLGQVTYYANNQVVVPAVDVNFTGPANQTVSTDSSGAYNATMISGGTWDAEPAKLGGFGYAVSALDAARVLQVVAGLNVTFTPNQRVACDVTGDGTLSALDAQRILQFSAGIITRFPVAQACGSDWLFYPAAGQVQPTVGNGMCQQGNIVLPNLNSTIGNQNFTGILFGDCTGNWTPGSGGVGAGSALRAFAPSATVVRSGPLRSAPGHRVRLRVYVQAPTPFSALDLKIAYDAGALTFRSAVPHGAAAHALTGINSGQPGVLAVSLASAKPITPTSGAVLVVEFDRSSTSSGAGAQLVGALVDEQSTRVAGTAH